MFLMLAYPLHGQVGGGWALEISSFWAQMELAYRLDAISQGPKFSNPLPLALIMDMHASKTLCTGLFKS